jgi:hypothetical protein
MQRFLEARKVVVYFKAANTFPVRIETPAEMIIKMPPEYNSEEKINSSLVKNSII